MANRYYAIPDIHGCLNLLQSALQQIFKVNPDGGKIIFLGDYIDRGPDSTAVLDVVMNPPEGWEYICLKGNHEEMFHTAFEFDATTNQHQLAPYANLYDWNVFLQMGGKIENNVADFTDFDPKYLLWMRKLPLAHIEGNNIFAHAWYDVSVDLERQDSTTVLWFRAGDHERFPSFEHQPRYLTHGHTPRQHGPVRSMGRTNLDTGAVFYGRLVVAEYRDDKMGPVTFHEFT